tara:strand:+ start:256 stop:546 length:291 start_codon:yes stop_codon:yes gene_type:complete
VCGGDVPLELESHSVWELVWELVLGSVLQGPVSQQGVLIVLILLTETATCAEQFAFLVFDCTRTYTNIHTSLHHTLSRQEVYISYSMAARRRDERQ